MLNNPNISPWPQFEPDEIAAATLTLSTGKVNYWTGELGRQFEEAYAKSVGKQFGVALSNGTVALELALRVLGIKAGDEVIVASRSYVASASCVVLIGAKPIFADVDIDSGNISAETIAPLITAKTKAIIPVHIAGWPCDMPAIMTLANQHNLKVIEDCAQAHGATIAGKPVGAWGHAAIFSFCQDKIISTGGEGGMLLLDDEVSYKQAWAYKDIGRSYDLVYHYQHPEGFRWLTESAGSNFRMTEFQAAIGLLQLKKLPAWILKRNQHAALLTEVFDEFEFIEIAKPAGGQEITHAYYRLYGKVKSNISIGGVSNQMLRDKLVKQFNLAGVPCFVGSCAEVYREKVFTNLQLQPMSRHKNAALFSENAFCLLVHHTITDRQMVSLAEKIRQELSGLRCINE